MLLSFVAVFELLPGCYGGTFFFGIICMETIGKKGERVRQSSSPKVNQRVDEEIKRNIAGYSSHGPAAIQSRIRALDKKWDIERTLQINAAILALSGSLLAAFVNKKWLILPAVVTTFLAQHAIQGWCPPLPLFRRLRIKSRPEMDREKYALKALRGDFANVRHPQDAWKAVNA